MDKFKLTKVEIEVVEVDGKVFVNALQLIKLIQGIYSDVPPPPPPTK